MIVSWPKGLMGVERRVGVGYDAPFTRASDPGGAERADEGGCNAYLPGQQWNQKLYQSSIEWYRVKKGV